MLPRVIPAAIAFMAIAAVSFAQEKPPSPDEVVRDDIRRHGVIQERKFDPAHEFRLSLGYLPQDPFWKAAGPDFGYVWHKSHTFSWEIVRAGFYASYDSEIRNKLRSEFDAARDPYEKAQFYTSTHARWTPFYGRYTFMNRGVVHQELYFTAGAGVMGWTKPEDPDNGVGAGGVFPVFDGGFGFRWYTGRRFSFTLEVLEQAAMRSTGEVTDQFYVSFGASFNLPRARSTGRIAAAGENEP